MRDAIEAETVLFEEGSETGSSGWTSFNNLSIVPSLASEINKAGWNFYYKAGDIKATVFGFDTRKMARTRVEANHDQGEITSGYSGRDRNPLREALRGDGER